MATNKMAQPNSKRIHWMDNLRTITILLVMLYHVGGVYEAGDLWGWFWIVDDPDTISWVSIVGIMFDIMVMPTIFFISGYLTPPSVEKNTSWGFLKGKFKRLMIPWVIAVFTLIPIYKIIFLYSRGLPQEDWSSYFHFTTPTSQNWLWFLPLLFFFNVIYLLVEKSGIKLPRISLAWAVVLTFLVSVAFSIVIGSLSGFRSWTLTPILDFENERLLANFCFFILGTMSYRRDIFAELPKSKTLYTVVNSVAWLPVTGHIFARVWPFFVPDFSVTFLFRVLWFVSLHLSSLLMVYLMVESFWRYLDKAGKVWDELNKNSYGVYIIHVIIIGVFGTILLNLSLPAVVKWLLLIASTYLGSNLLVSLYRAGRKALFSERENLTVG
jgi:fucose 4-O-acetylase-like acetyltransferase